MYRGGGGIGDYSCRGRGGEKNRGTVPIELVYFRFVFFVINSGANVDMGSYAPD